MRAYLEWVCGSRLSFLRLKTNVWSVTKMKIYSDSDPPHRHSTYNKKQKSENVIRSQYLKYTGHLCRCPNTTLTKKMMFAKPGHDPYKRDPWTNIAKSFKLMSPLSRQRGLHKIRVVLLHLSTMQSPVQLHGNRYKVWRILTVLYCYLQ